MSSRFGLSSVLNVETLFPISVGMSAFLLFTLELVAGQLVLPVFGGTPGVWATTLCFFTAVLFLGYLYAHLVVTRLGPIRGGRIHQVIAVVAVIPFIVAPRDIASLRQPGMPEALNVLLALLAIAGPIAFVFASTTPLLSAWYAMARPNPWWLYATSNGASFAALLVYPFVLAPLIGLSAQRWLIVVGSVILLAGLSVIILAIRRGSEPEDSNPEPSVPAPSVLAEVAPPSPTVATFDIPVPEAVAAVVDQPTVEPPPMPTRRAEPSRRRQAIWLFAAFVPAGLLSATTNFITTDLISAPLLWIGPLAVYLLSFVIAFSTRGQRVVRFAQILVPAAAALLWIPWAANATWPVAAILFVELLGFLVLAVAIHGRLAADRPSTRHLTRFYLALSAGGMLATAFVALIAPNIFSAIYEYPILIVAGLAALAILPDEGATTVSLRPVPLLRDLAIRLVPYLVATAVLVFFVSGGDMAVIGPIAWLFLAGGYAIAIAVWPVVLPVSTAVAIVLATLYTPNFAVFQTRTFFGVLRVDALNGLHSEYSGTTLHGAQYLDQRQTEPTTYYVQSGPLSQVIDHVRATVAHPAVAVVGLGVGTTEAYATPADRFTFFEISQAAVDVANDSTLFTYLSNAPLSPKIVLGDARLSMMAQPAGSFDLIILDAFSSDSVPVHLLTREAIATYQRVLRPGGLILFHVTNRYYDLSPAVMSTAQSIGLNALATSYVPDASSVVQLDATSSRWVAVGVAAAVQPLSNPEWTDLQGGPVLTDDFSDLLRTLRP